MSKRILVPRIVDENNTNAQNLNAKALLSRFTSNEFTWVATHYAMPDLQVSARRNVDLVRLWPGRWWRLRMLLFYLQNAQGLFYPGGTPDAHWALALSQRIFGRRVVIATLEGLGGTRRRESDLSQLVGHEVRCFRVDEAAQRRSDALFRHSDHIIAISPFLGRVAQYLHGGAVSVLPLGIDLSVFYPRRDRISKDRPVVISAGSLSSRKRPEIFMVLAERYPHADFVWYGEGDLRASLSSESAERRLHNLKFAGAIAPSRLAEAFRCADVFVLPSLCEGAPKVLQEATACGIPVVAFGFYEAPSVVDGENGYVVWSDEELVGRIGRLLDSVELRRTMGNKGAAMALGWSWDVLAAKWEQQILSVVLSGGRDD